MNDFGPYTEHPVAALFPLLRDVDRTDFARLLCSIRDDGQIEPIVLDGTVIVDGRNRYLACVEAEVEPRFVQVADLNSPMPAHQYAYEKNANRRHLTDDQRATALAGFMRIDEAEFKRQRAEGGKKGGRPSAVNLVPNSVQGSEKLKRAERTVDKVAKSAKVSTYKAQQALNLVQNGTAEDVQAVVSGKTKLKDAAAKLKPKQPEPVATPISAAEAATIREITAEADAYVPKERARCLAAWEKLPERVQRLCANAVSQKVKERFATEFPTERARLDASWAAAKAQRDEYFNLSQTLDKRMTRDDTRKILSCLHPDKHPAEQHAQYAEAFSIFKRFMEQCIEPDGRKLRGVEGWK